MKLKIFTAVFIVVAIVFAVYSAIKSNEFKPAEAFPREALIYVQVADLPALVKLWNESKFKGKYTNSANFQEFQTSHLGLKLASRWEEFNAASGFPIDLQIVAALADKRAAIAVYDIGKLEFVFIAPVSDEVFAATKFAQNQDNFETQTLDDGTTIYRATIEADRGRQKQELIFCHLKGQLVIATSEKLLAQTLKNINSGKPKNSLANEPLFNALAEKTVPHLATVWVNQNALNEDYYFKHYWLMADAAKLKNIRAGMFDFSIEEEKIIERRKFLQTEKISSAPITDTHVGATLAFLPMNMPFYQLRKADAKLTGAAIENTLFDRPQNTPQDENNFNNLSFDNFGDYSDYHDYSNLNADFDEEINDAEDEEIAEKVAAETDFSCFLEAANPQTILTFTEPRILQPAPLFLEFNRAAIFNLSAPGALDRAELEAAIARKFSEQTTISASGAKLNWETKTENELQWRELDLPMLGINASCAIRGDNLILTNNAEFLRRILEDQNLSKAEQTGVDSFVNLTVLNLDQTINAYDDVFAELAGYDAADDFFTGNIASLLASISEFKRVEIRENSADGFSEQTIVAFR